MKKKYLILIVVMVLALFMLVNVVYSQTLQVKPLELAEVQCPGTVVQEQTLVMSLEHNVESYIFHVTLGKQNRISYLADDLSIQPEDLCVVIEGIPGESEYAIRFKEDGPGVYSHPEYDEWWREQHQAGLDLLRDSKSFWVQFVPGRQNEIRVESELVSIEPSEPAEVIMKEGALAGVTVDGRFMPALSVVIESTPDEQFTVRFDDQGGLLLKLRPEKSAFTMDLGGDAMGLAVDNIMETEAETFSATSFISLGRNPQTGKDIAVELISEISSKKTSGLSIIVVDGTLALEHIGEAISNVNEFLPLSPPKK